MPWSLTRGQTVAIVLLVAALLTDAVLTLHNIREVATSVQWVSHTHEVLGQLEQVVSTLKDAETGQRGYLLTGERVYLEPYEQAVPRIGEQLARLRDLTIDNPPQTAHVLKLEQLTGERLAVLRQGLDRFQAESDRGRALALSRQYLLQGEGKRVMDLIRDEIYGMQQLERALLARRVAASRANTRTALATTIVGLSLGLLLVTMVITLVARNLAARRRAADVLHAERERFRTTLTSIGDAVVATDAQGRITLLNPIAQALTGWSAEALGEPLDTVFRIVNEATRETVENPVSKVIRLGAIVGLANHTVLIAKDGSELPIDDSGAPIRDARGRIVGVVLVFRDVTAAAGLGARPGGRGPAQGRVPRHAGPRAPEPARPDSQRGPHAGAARHRRRPGAVGLGRHRAAGRPHDPPRGRSARRLAHHVGQDHAAARDGPGADVLAQAAEAAARPRRAGGRRSTWTCPRTRAWWRATRRGWPRRSATSWTTPSSTRTTAGGSGSARGSRRTRS